MIEVRHLTKLYGNHTAVSSFVAPKGARMISLFCLISAAMVLRLLRITSNSMLPPCPYFLPPGLRISRYRISARVLMIALYLL